MKYVPTFREFFEFNVDIFDKSYVKKNLSAHITAFIANSPLCTLLYFESLLASLLESVSILSAFRICKYIKCVTAILHFEQKTTSLLDITCVTLYSL